MRIFRTTQYISDKSDNGHREERTSEFKAPRMGAALVSVTPDPEDRNRLTLLWLLADRSVDAGIIGVVEHRHD